VLFAAAAATAAASIAAAARSRSHDLSHSHEGQRAATTAPQSPPSIRGLQAADFAKASLARCCIAVHVSPRAAAGAVVRTQVRPARRTAYT
jgi:hypothetical protein